MCAAAAARREPAVEAPAGADFCDALRVPCVPLRDGHNLGGENALHLIVRLHPTKIRRHPDTP